MGVVVLAIVMTAIGAIVWPGGPSRRARSASVQSKGVASVQWKAVASVRVPVAAVPAARYPEACLSVGIALHDPRFGRASFDRTIPCVSRFEASTGERARPPVHSSAWYAVRRHT
jgi:hypothetical protein